MEASVCTMKSMYSLMIPYIKRHHGTRITELSLNGKRGHVSRVTTMPLEHVKYRARQESE